MSSQLVWLITGTTSGLGRDLALEALKRGDKVIATGRARSVAKLADLKEKGADVLELDVTAPLEDLHEIAKKDLSEDGGALNGICVNNVTRMFMIYMQVGALCGTLCHYQVGTSRSICIDFGYFRTAFLAADQRAPQVARIPDYQETSQRAEAALQAYNGKQPGDPLKGVAVIADVVKGEGGAAGKPFPRSLALGTDCYTGAKQSSLDAIERLEAWKEVSFSTDYED
ncbi:hypothetical protein NLJ89_g1610 [Agrocybe chaxingu]|uniref:NAD(P)-binding protein n=1 Tax=Agrocybe chaxingu TaxID=84603 RepID=A0A9W8MZR0_9AGAR|nr:hypothetical protein NLJ89_g1610 [Agrocybe chaxingu]